MIPATISPTGLDHNARFSTHCAAAAAKSPAARLPKIITKGSKIGPNSSPNQLKKLIILEAIGINTEPIFTIICSNCPFNPSN